MKVDEFAKLVRKGDGRLRVDNVTVSAGNARFRGSGVLVVATKELRLELTLSAKSKAPDEHKPVWNEADFWKLRGVIEHSLPFTATHVSPGTRTYSNGINMVSLRFHAINLTPRRTSEKERKALRLRFDELSKRYSNAAPPETEATPSPKRRTIALARFTATLVNSKLLAENEVTHTLRRNSFLGKTTGWEADTYVEKGRDFDVALVKEGTDLQVHFRSKARYRSKSAAEDRERFQAVLDAIGFTHGFNAWPYRVQQWREGREEMDRLTAPQRLPKTVHAPFDQALGASGAPPPIQLVARFFARRSALSRRISEFLFTFRQAGEERVHLPVRTLAFCSLFEGLVHLLFRELALEPKLRESSPDFDAFLVGRDRLVAELEAKGKTGAAASKRLAGLLAHAEAVRVKDKFKALCDAFGLDYPKMKPHFDAWYAERNPLMHGTWKEHNDKNFVHQARIAGAINILLLKLMGYSGKVVAVRFGAAPSETYRTI
jgi:hypothetical protein